MDTPFNSDNQTVLSNSKYSVQYSATLFNYQLRGKGGFYGRTLMSEPKALTASMTSGGMLECHEEESIYFHTNYTEKSSVVVVEIVVTREFNFQKS